MYSVHPDPWIVIGFECAYDVPPKQTTEVFWCEEVAKKLKRDFKKSPDNLKQLLLDTMVVIQLEL